MPGKGDFNNTITPTGKGQYFPGEKAYRAWDEGWREGRCGTSLRGENPFDQTNQPKEWDGWDNGWVEGNDGTFQRMPAPVCPPA